MTMATGYTAHFEGYIEIWELTVVAATSYRLQAKWLFSKGILDFEVDRGLWLQATRRFFEVYTEIGS